MKLERLLATNWREKIAGNKKGAKKMFNLIVVYEDGFTKSEVVDDPVTVFNACGIYLQDPECSSVLCLDLETREFIIDYTRE